jgi:hypothetical protein
MLLVELCAAADTADTACDGAGFEGASVGGLAAYRGDPRAGQLVVNACVQSDMPEGARRTRCARLSG